MLVFNFILQFQLILIEYNFILCLGIKLSGSTSTYGQFYPKHKIKLYSININWKPQYKIVFDQNRLKLAFVTIFKFKNCIQSKSIEN